MVASVRPAFLRAPSLSFVLLGGLFIVLWIAGGASRGDVPAQWMVRGAAWVGILIATLFGARPEWRTARPALFFLLAALLLVCLQLIPLPPSIWQALPGRTRFVEAVLLAGQSQPWRPLAIVPDAAVNAAASLVVPTAVLLLAVGSTEAERAKLPSILLALISLSTMVGILQFSGVRLGNPLINYSPGEVSGNFANRNHFALFLALGCLIAPTWAFVGERRPGWRAPVAFGLVSLFILVILASGSRAGILLAAFGLVIGLLLARRGIRRALARGARWVFPSIIVGIVGMIATLVLLSVVTDRAVSVQRIFATDAEQDMRVRALPTVLAMIGFYFPVGSGFGGFDPIFRLHEPFALLKPTYFNHAHNDFTEIALDGGLPAVLLLVAALGWWAYAGIRVWRLRSTTYASLPRLGFAMLLLIFMASIVDYPARTPLMMAMIAIATLWLGRGANSAVGQTIPGRYQHLYG